MRWDCGETWDEKVARRGQWARWFAWRPVRVADHDCRWLEYVERRADPVDMWEYWGWEWEYR